MTKDAEDPITLDDLAIAALDEYPQWQACIVLCTKPVTSDAPEENGACSFKMRPGYDVRLMVSELRHFADELERALNAQQS